MILRSSGMPTMASTTQPTRSAMLMSILDSPCSGSMLKRTPLGCPLQAARHAVRGGYHRPVSHDPHFDLPPSAWVQRWLAWIRPGGAVLDVAAGSGRHARLLARMGFEVDA